MSKIAKNALLCSKTRQKIKTTKEKIENVLKKSESLKLSWLDENVKESRIKGITEAHKRKDVKQKHKAALKKAYSDPALREEIKNRSLEMHKCEDFKLKHSESLKNMFKKEDVRNRHSNSLISSGIMKRFLRALSLKATDISNEDIQHNYYRWQRFKENEMLGKFSESELAALRRFKYRHLEPGKGSASLEG